MKKYISMIFAIALLVASLAGCGQGDPKAQQSGKLQIVTTIFPEYDWVMNILGSKAENADVTMLLDNGVDLHSYQPTAEDILKIATCDIFIYVGGESDEWVEDALKEATNKDMTVINLLELLGDKAKEEEHVEGMQEEEHDHEDEHDHEHEEHELDEHVWLSLSNAAEFVSSISEAVQKADPDNAAAYQKNASSYIEKLIKLDDDYQLAVWGTTNRTILFGDRFPFRYMVDDYGIKYYAAFAGCSAETEASFETVTFLAAKIDELSLHTVLTIEGSDQRIAKTIIQNTSSKDQQVLSLDSMQSTTAKDVEQGASYLSVMEANLNVLKEALK